MNDVLLHGALEVALEVRSYALEVIERVAITRFPSSFDSMSPPRLRDSFAENV
jgi:hypothetical protein